MRFKGFRGAFYGERAARPAECREDALPVSAIASDMASTTSGKTGVVAA